MMGKRWLTMLLALGLADATVQAQTSNPPDQKTAPPKSQGSTGTGKAPQSSAPPKAGSSFGANQVVGKIKSVNRSTKEVTIDQAGEVQKLKLSDNATVFTNGRLGAFEDLREGQQVRAAYEERGGQKTLRWIEVTPTGAGGSTDQGIDSHGNDSSTPKPAEKQPSPPANEADPGAPKAK
jgi:Cu/Ag efflux protein CusF